MLHFRGKVTFSHCLSVTCFRQSNRTERPPLCDPHDEYSETEPTRLSFIAVHQHKPSLCAMDYIFYIDQCQGRGLDSGDRTLTGAGKNILSNLLHYDRNFNCFLLGIENY